MQVYDYQSPLATTKISLAVSPFEVQEKVYVFGDITVSGAELTKQFSQRLTTLLRESGRFDLLDRDYDKAFRDEINIIKSGDADLEQKGRLKQVQGADYLLTGRIRRAEITTELKDIPTTGIRSGEYRGHFVGEVRLLVPATRQVAFSHEYRIKLETPEVMELADDWQRDERDWFRFRAPLWPGDYQLAVQDAQGARQVFPFHVSRDAQESDLTGLTPTQIETLEAACGLQFGADRLADIPAGSSARRAEPAWTWLLMSLLLLMAAELGLAGLLSRRRQAQPPAVVMDADPSGDR